MTERTRLKVLFAEDEPDLRERIRIVLEMHFDAVVTAANGREALESFRREPADVVVCDIRMPVMDGLELAAALRELAPQTPVILCTAFTETSYLLRAIELGVAGYLRKPLDCQELVDLTLRCAAPILQRAELAAARRQEQATLELLLGSGPAMAEVIAKVQKVAATEYSLILQGETGTGKSFLAAAVHGLSPRRNGPLVTLSVAALPETLVENQLFGHAKGAFTGATSAASGLFEQAQGGTLVIDDINCLPLATQPKLLHVVEHKEFHPLGSTKTVSVDTRIIAASNVSLQEAVRQGAFRQDLFYRLSDLIITLPPLRERGDELPALARGFLEQAADELGRPAPRLSPEGLFLLRRHPWPGNIRELKSVMKRAALFAAGDAVDAAQVAALLDLPPGAGCPCGAALPRTMEEIKRQAVAQALEVTQGRKMEAARLLDLDYSSFKRLLERYRL